MEGFAKWSSQKIVIKCFITLSRILSWGTMAEPGTRQFLAPRHRQSDNGIEFQWHEKIKMWNILRPWCLNGEATTNIDIIQQLTIVWPVNVATLSRQYAACPDQHGTTCKFILICKFKFKFFDLWKLDSWVVSRYCTQFFLHKKVIFTMML